MRSVVKIIVVAVILTAGIILCPRPPADVFPRRVLAQALRANPAGASDAVDMIRQDLREGCTPSIIIE